MPDGSTIVPMTIELPTALSLKLSEFEESGERLSIIPLAAELDAAIDPNDALSPEQRRGCLAEIASLRFMAANGADREPWGIYFQPIGTSIDNAGVPHYGPDARWMDAEIIEYWKKRAGENPCGSAGPVCGSRAGDRRAMEPRSS